MKNTIIITAFLSVLFIQGNAAASGIKNLPIEFGGVIEIEAYQTSPYDGDSSSDITVATVELTADAKINEQISASIGLLYEQDETDLEVDTAILTFGPTDSNWSVSVGQLYVPFGVYDSNMVSDPLTLDIGEARETAAVFDYTIDNLSAAFYLFNGTNNKNNGADDNIDNFGFSIIYTSSGDINFTGSLGYINDVGDSDGIEAGLLTTDVQDHIPGFTAAVRVDIGDINFIAEYIAARDSFQETELEFNESGAKPSAFNLEAGYSFNLAGKPASIGLGYQTTDEALALELPEKRIITALSVDVLKNTTLGFEYNRDEDYDVASGGSGKSAHTFTLQLAVEF